MSQQVEERLWGAWTGASQSFFCTTFGVQVSIYSSFKLKLKPPTLPMHLMNTFNSLFSVKFCFSELRM